ncbi:MAG: gamma carbonic anhydrase family protein [Gammaproteobacteria bacterium]|nr:gamma carbonic anhydrase family protein [Gammaproteobacteria bacterium]
MFFQIGDRRVVAEGDHFVAPGAMITGSVLLKHNVNVWFNAVIRGDVEPITVGAYTNVQDCAVLHTDLGSPLLIGDFVTVGHKVTLHGCEIGENSLIGINAVVLSGAKVGRNCLIGANALVTEGKEIPDNSMVLGAPGKVVRQLSEEEIRGLRRSAEGYVQRAQWYLAEFSNQEKVDRP